MSHFDPFWGLVSDLKTYLLEIISSTVYPQKLSDVQLGHLPAPA